MSYVITGAAGATVWDVTNPRRPAAVALEADNSFLARTDTLRELEGVTPVMVDVRPAGSENSIGATLYHVALIEADWLFDDLLGQRLETTEVAQLFPVDDRDEAGTLSPLAGVTLEEHIDRLVGTLHELQDRFRRR